MQAYTSSMENEKLFNKIAKLRNPAPTTDVIIYDKGLGIVLIERKNPPFGFALPGGFIDYGEFAEHAAIREMQEETSLKISLCGLLGVYSNPTRDERFHTMSIAYVGKAHDVSLLCAGDDAKAAAFYPLDNLPPLAFDHDKIIQDFKLYLQGQRPLIPLDITEL